VPGEVAWVFFDLDGTLWDHAGSSMRALHQVSREFGLPPDAFIPRFEEANDAAWKQLAEGKTTRDRMRVERFAIALAALDAPAAPSIDVDRLSRRYLEVYLQDPNGHWIDGGREILEAVDRAGKRVALLTNGFSDTQVRKIEEAGESQAVDFIWGPEEAGCLKPRRAFFETAMARAGCDPGQALMIGDSLTADILPALSMGMRAWWFNPDGETAGKRPEVAITGARGGMSGMASSSPPPCPSFSRLAQLLPLFAGGGA